MQPKYDHPDGTSSLVGLAANAYGARLLCFKVGLAPRVVLLGLPGSLSTG